MATRRTLWQWGPKGGWRLNVPRTYDAHTGDTRRLSTPGAMSVTEESRSSAAALIEGSATLRRGRADVLKVRMRTKLKRFLRAIVLIGAIDTFLWYRYMNNR